MYSKALKKKMKKPAGTQKSEPARNVRSEMKHSTVKKKKLKDGSGKTGLFRIKKKSRY